MSEALTFEEAYPVEWKREKIQRLFAELERRGWTCEPAIADQDDITRTLLAGGHPKNISPVAISREVDGCRRRVFYRLDTNSLLKEDDALAEMTHKDCLAYCRILDYEIKCPCGVYVRVPKHEGPDRPPEVYCPCCGYAVSHYWTGNSREGE